MAATAAPQPHAARPPFSSEWAALAPGHWIPLEDTFKDLIEGNGAVIRDVAGEISSMLFTPVEHAIALPDTGAASGSPVSRMDTFTKLWSGPGLWWHVELLPLQTYMCEFRVSGCLKSLSMDWILALENKGREGTVARGGIAVRFSGSVSFRGGYRGAANRTFTPHFVQASTENAHPEQELVMLLFVQIDEALNARVDGMVTVPSELPSLSVRPSFGTAYAASSGAIGRCFGKQATKGHAVPKFLTLGVHFLSLHCARGVKVQFQKLYHWQRLLEDDEEAS